MLDYLEKELETVRPDRIAFLTFTRAARIEALSRTKMSEDSLPFVRTIHAIAYRNLGVSQSRMVSPKDIREFGRKLGVELTGQMYDPWNPDSQWREPSKEDRLLQLNHLGRHQMLHLKDTLRNASLDFDYHQAKWFTQAYRDWKDSESLLDYTDLLTQYLEIGTPLNVDTIFIDEAQDLSKLQWAVVHKLGANATRWYTAGDDDQAIFTWAGASPEAFNNEPADVVRVLDLSYRLPLRVHEFSERIIRRVRSRYDKQFRAREAEGVVRPIRFVSYDVLDGDSTFVLFRNYHRGAMLAEQLERMAHPFRGLSILDDEKVNTCLEAWKFAQEKRPLTSTQIKYLAHFANPAHLKVSKPSRPKSLDEVFVYDIVDKQINFVLPRLPKLHYLSNAISLRGIDAVLNPKVWLMSIHQSKGRQANTVILDSDMARRTYEGYMRDPDSEHRVFYVGVTRAKERLFPIVPETPMSYRM